MRLKISILRCNFSLAGKPILEANCEFVTTVYRHKLVKIMIFIPLGKKTVSDYRTTKLCAMVICILFSSTPLDQPAVWVHWFLSWRLVALCARPPPKMVIVLEPFWEGTWVLGSQLLQACCIYTVSPSQWRKWLWETALLPTSQGTKA